MLILWVGGQATNQYSTTQETQSIGIWHHVNETQHSTMLHIPTKKYFFTDVVEKPNMHTFEIPYLLENKKWQKCFIRIKLCLYHGNHLSLFYFRSIDCKTQVEPSNKNSLEVNTKVEPESALASQVSAQ